jgi:hypothetical protein
MPYWKMEGQYINCPTFPLFDPETELTFTITFVNDTDTTWLHCYLYVDSEYEGMIFARLHGETEYSQLGVACNSEAFIGECIVGETAIDFKVVAMEGYTDCFSYAIPIYMGHDDGVPLPNKAFQKDWEDDVQWTDCWSDDIAWQTDWTRTTTTCPTWPASETCYADTYGELWATSFDRGLWRTDY